LNLCEGGIAAVLAGELAVGESVAIVFHLPHLADPLRTQAIVRYQDSLCCGFEFADISAEQLTEIRDWAEQTEIFSVINDTTGMKRQRADPKSKKGNAAGAGDGVRGNPTRKWRGVGWGIPLVLTAVMVAVFCWKWNRDWEELESGLSSKQAASAAKPQLQVPAEVMQKLLVHRVEPTYPADARKDHLQGIIALDVVVGSDGSVVSMHPLNGPDVLARAAMNALRWWKFTPYRVNGEPAAVETTVAVEFKR
jgi:TonB family protein